MIDNIQQIFKENNNKWMTDREVFNILNERGFKWGPNKKGSVGHKNMVSRELSDRHRDKFDIDKRIRPQKYRLKNFNNKEVNSEIAFDLYICDEKENLYIDKNVYINEKDSNITEFILDTENISFQKYDIPNSIKNRKKGDRIGQEARKIDYEKKEKSNKIKGSIGEEAVILIEKNKLKLLGRKDLIEEVKWVSKEKGDGLGYDIISWDVNSNGESEKIYIEVKTTEGDINTPFDISDTEVRASKKLSESYYIYRIFGIEKVTHKINYYIIEGDVQSKFDLIPTSYKAYIKTNETK